MTFKFMMPTTIYVQQHAVREQGSVLNTLGNKPMIVTGKYSAKASGALEDVLEVLKLHKKTYVLFDEIENNPSVETIEKASTLAKAQGVDYVIGIGGGSPLDAAKAVAVLVANPKMIGIDLFNNDFTEVLPIVEIPTTAGTGSEVTPYSVLIRQDLQTKMSFGTVNTFPKYAFIDARYTESLSLPATVSTAIDALTHVMEGYVANRSTPLTDAIALDGVKAFAKSKQALLEGTLTMADRENLMYVSLLGGIIIAQAGVTLAHGMGYCYTYFKGIPHGKANGLIMYEYLKYLDTKVPDKMNELLLTLGFEKVETLIEYFKQLLGDAPMLTAEEVEQYTRLSLLQKGSMSNTPGRITEVEVHHFWKCFNKGLSKQE